MNKPAPICYLSFTPNNRGYGRVVLHNDSLIVFDHIARTGSIGPSGKLVDPIYAGTWMGRELPVKTTERGMWIARSGYGWKYRLWDPRGNWSHYLIHPDGNAPGTFGCIGLVDDDCLDLFSLLTVVHKKQSAVPVLVGIPEPDRAAIIDKLEAEGAVRHGNFVDVA